MEVATEAFQKLDSEAQKTVLQRSGIGSPGQATANKLWTIAIIIIGGALVLSVIALVAGWGDTKSTLLVFTTSIGALTGLFAPSPLQGQS
jgi:hypothetical protein